MQLRGLAKLLRDFGLADIRTTQDQNLMMLSVAQAGLFALVGRLVELRLALPRLATTWLPVLATPPAG